MTIRSTLGVTLLLLFVVVLGMALAGEVKLDYYEHLQAQADTIVDRGERMLPFRVTPDEVDSQLVALKQDSLARVVLLTDQLEEREVQFFRLGQLKVADFLDEGGRRVRRDIRDDSGRVRIEVYYGRNGNVAETRYLDESGDEVHSKSEPFPYLGPWRLY